MAARELSFSGLWWKHTYFSHDKLFLIAVNVSSNLQRSIKYTVNLSRLKQLIGSPWHVICSFVHFVQYDSMKNYKNLD